MKRIIPFGVACTAVVFGMSGEGTASSFQKHPVVEPLVRVVPLIRVGENADMKVRLAVEPASGRPVRYLFRNDELPMDRVYFDLLRDGEVVQPLEGEGRRMFSPDRVRELKPGEQLIHTLDLRERYGQLKPGRYILEVRAAGRPSELGLAQLNFRERAAYIDVEGGAVEK